MDTKRKFAEEMAQEKDFTYLDTADFSATVCDREGTVLYQNEKAVLRDGNVTPVRTAYNFAELN